MNHNVSVILPVINETFSLRQTVDILLKENKEAIQEILIMTAKVRTTSESRRAINELQTTYPGVIVAHDQNLPFLDNWLQQVRLYLHLSLQLFYYAL